MLMKWLSFGRRPRAGSRPTAPGGRMVWRITAEHPQGAWVDADTRPSRPRESTSPAPFDSWTTSSMDLRDGVQVVEDEAHGPQDPRPH